MAQPGEFTIPFGRAAKFVDQQSMKPEDYYAVYGLFSAEEKKYTIYRLDMATKERAEILSFESGTAVNDTTPSIFPYDDETIVLNGGIININGENVADQFVPLGINESSFAFSHDGQKLFYHNNQIGQGLPAIGAPGKHRLRNFTTREDFGLKPPQNGGAVAPCYNITWNLTNTIVYCLASQTTYAINAGDGTVSILNFVIEGVFYPDQNLLLKVLLTHRGEGGPPSSLVTVDTGTQKETTVYTNETETIWYVQLLPEKDRILLGLGNAIYEADLPNVKNTLKKVVSDASSIESVARNGKNIAFVQEDNDGKEPYIDTVFVGDTEGGPALELYTSDRGVAIQNVFAGWFPK